VLGRARRRVLVFDSGEKRNEASTIQHAILGADGFNRRDFLDGARQQVGSVRARLGRDRARMAALEGNECCGVGCMGCSALRGAADGQAGGPLEVAGSSGGRQLA